MKKENAIKYYRKFSGADSYIIGFVYKHNLYMSEMKEIMPRYITVERGATSKGGHEKLQLRMKNAHMEQLIKKGAICLGNENLLTTNKNRGVAFENLVYEFYGQTPREKDNVGFWVQGDIRVNNVEIQIKLNGAQIVEFRTLNRLQKELRG